MNEILNPNTNVTFGRNLDNEVFLEVRRNVSEFLLQTYFTAPIILCPKKLEALLNVMKKYPEKVKKVKLTVSNENHNDIELFDDLIKQFYGEYHIRKKDGHTLFLLNYNKKGIIEYVNEGIRLKKIDDNYYDVSYDEKILFKDIKKNQKRNSDFSKLKKSDVPHPKFTVEENGDILLDIYGEFGMKRYKFANIYSSIDNITGGDIENFYYTKEGERILKTYENIFFKIEWVRKIYYDYHISNGKLIINPKTLFQRKLAILDKIEEFCDRNKTNIKHNKTLNEIFDIIKNAALKFKKELFQNVLPFTSEKMELKKYKNIFKQNDNDILKYKVETGSSEDLKPEKGEVMLAVVPGPEFMLYVTFNRPIYPIPENLAELLHVMEEYSENVKKVDFSIFDEYDDYSNIFEFLMKNYYGKFFSRTLRHETVLFLEYDDKGIIKFELPSIKIEKINSDYKVAFNENNVFKNSEFVKLNSCLENMKKLQIPHPEIIFEDKDDGVFILKFQNSESKELEYKFLNVFSNFKNIMTGDRENYYYKKENEHICKTGKNIFIKIQRNDDVYNTYYNFHISDGKFLINPEFSFYKKLKMIEDLLRFCENNKKSSEFRTFNEILTEIENYVQNYKNNLLKDVIQFKEK